MNFILDSGINTLSSKSRFGFHVFFLAFYQKRIGTKQLRSPGAELPRYGSYQLPVDVDGLASLALHSWMEGWARFLAPLRPSLMHFLL